VPAAARLTVAVNVAAPELTGRDGPSAILSVLRQEQLPPNALVVELTETSLHGDVEVLARSLHALRACSVKTAIDDVGSGYSSLALLARLPVDTLKIDQSFVAGVDREPTSRAIVAAIVAIAGTLDAHTIAEGVETRHQLEGVRELGVDAIQGHYFAPAVPADELARIVSRPSTVLTSRA
jgi:EAL domain-containing protein (putative c-di-GMP-specific phosphodiesterase class I)